MKSIGKRVVIAAFVVLGGLSLITMASPSQSTAAPGFRPVMPMHQVAPPPMRPMTGRVTTFPQMGTNGFLGGTNPFILNNRLTNSFNAAANSGMSGFTAGGLAAFNRASFLRGTAFTNATLGSGFGFTGFSSGLGATPFTTGFGATGLGAARTPVGSGAGRVPFINGFQNLNGLGASPTFSPANFNGTKFGFNGSDGL
jgi:hypothetical protein